MTIMDINFLMCHTTMLLIRGMDITVCVVLYSPLYATYDSITHTQCTNSFISQKTTKFQMMYFVIVTPSSSHIRIMQRKQISCKPMVCAIRVSNHQDLSSHCNVSILVTNGVCLKTKKISYIATIAHYI